ncbi:hypothetical protein SBADM41S_06728 [Streptomyces badius]
MVIARQLRALENLVHEASHYNWTRHRRRLNDVLGYLLAAAPTGSRISAYRTSHLLHHGRFGTAEDPDRYRYAELDMEALPRTSARLFVAGVCTRLLRYQLGWLRELRTNALAPLVALLWSVLCVGAPTALLLDLRTGGRRGRGLALRALPAAAAAADCAGSRPSRPAHPAVRSRGQHRQDRRGRLGDRLSGHRQAHAGPRTARTC